MTIIYGIDTEKPVSPKDVRDAIVECFTQAHSEALADLESYNKELTKADFEQMKRMNIRQMVRNYFEEVGGDYDSPTKDSIMSVIGKLKEFAEHFRDKDMIEKHFNEIKMLLEKL
jgi:hypothetical protein